MCHANYKVMEARKISVKVFYSNSGLSLLNTNSEHAQIITRGEFQQVES